MAARLLMLDRDGVINHDSAEFIKSPNEWRPIPGSLEAIAEANQLGYRVVVVSNQSGLARGHLTITQLNRIHAKMIAALARYNAHVEAIFFCPHGPDDDCHCRKPRPGLLIEIRRRLGIDLHNSIFVGDRISDANAALAAGARAVLVKTGLNPLDVDALEDPRAVQICEDLASFIDELKRAE